MTVMSRRLAAFLPMIAAGVVGSLYIILNILVSTALDIATIPTAVLAAAYELFFWGNVAVQVAALIVGVMAGIERRRFTSRAGGATSTETPGTPAPHTSDGVFIMGDPGESATSVPLKVLGSSIRRNPQANSSPDKPISVEPTDLDYLIEESARWRMVAEHLARNLGKVEYANAAYQDLLDSDPFAN